MACVLDNVPESLVGIDEVVFAQTLQCSGVWAFRG